MDAILPALIIPVIASYLLLIFFMPSRYYVLRSNGIHLSFQLIVSSLLGLAIINYIYPYYESLIESLKNAESYWSKLYYLALPLEALSTLLYEVIIDVTPKSVNSDLVKSSSFYLAISLIVSTLLFFLERKLKDRIRPYFENMMGDRLDGQIVHTLRKHGHEQTPALITLNNGKVYVGYIVYVTSLGVHNKQFSLMPLFSGYRDSNHHLSLTNDYNLLWDSAETFKVNPAEVIKVEIGDDTEIEIDGEDFKRLANKAVITMRCDDILNVGTWLAELYNIQSVDSSHIQRI